MMIDGDKLVIASMIYAWNLPEDHPLRDLLIEEVQWGETRVLDILPHEPSEVHNC